MEGKIFPSAIKGMSSETWFIAERIGGLKYNYETEENPVGYLNKFNLLIQTLGFGGPVSICDIECTTKDFSCGYVIKYTFNSEFHKEFYRSLATGLDDIYNKEYPTGPIIVSCINSRISPSIIGGFFYLSAFPSSDNYLIKNRTPIYYLIRCTVAFYATCQCPVT